MTQSAQAPEVPKKSGRRPGWRMGLLLAVGVVVVAGIVYAAVFFLKEAPTEEKKEATTTKSQSANYNYTEAASEFQTDTTNNVDLEQLVADYGPKYEAAIKDFIDTDPTKWDSATVDKAFLCLLYADRTADYSRSQDIGFLIDVAEKSGVAVSKNSAGVTTEERTAMHQRAFQYLSEGVER